MRKTLSKGDKTSWLKKLYKNTKKNNDTIPSYKTDQLPEKCNESLLKETELTMKKKQNGHENFKFRVNQNVVDHQCLWKITYLLTPKHNHTSLQERFFFKKFYFIWLSAF